MQRNRDMASTCIFFRVQRSSGGTRKQKQAVWLQSPAFPHWAAWSTLTWVQRDRKDPRHPVHPPTTATHTMLSDLAWNRQPCIHISMYIFNRCTLIYILPLGQILFPSLQHKQTETSYLPVIRNLRVLARRGQAERSRTQIRSVCVIISWFQGYISDGKN